MNNKAEKEIMFTIAVVIGNIALILALYYLMPTTKYYKNYNNSSTMQTECSQEIE